MSMSSIVEVDLANYFQMPPERQADLGYISMQVTPPPSVCC